MVTELNNLFNKLGMRMLILVANIGRRSTMTIDKRQNRIQLERTKG